MYFKSILAIVLGICLAGQPLFATNNTKMTNKEIALKTLRIIGYGAGIIAPIKVLSYSYDQNTKIYTVYDSLADWAFRPFITLLDPSCFTEDFDKAFNKICSRTSLLGCMGYSAHGLYKELTPIVKALFVHLGHLAQDKTKKNTK